MAQELLIDEGEAQMASCRSIGRRRGAGEVLGFGADDVGRAPSMGGSSTFATEVVLEILGGRAGLLHLRVDRVRVALDQTAS